MQTPIRRRARRAMTAAALMTAMLLGAATPAHATPEPAAEPPPAAEGKAEPQLARQLDADRTVDFWVRFAQRADLTRASRIDDWAERGAAVARELRATAAASQVEVRATLDRRSVDYQPFWATNAIYVRGGSPHLAEELSAHPEVASLHATTAYQPPELVPGRTADTLDLDVAWNVAAISADRVWEQYGVQGEGITVANIDTGVQFDHPALVDRYRGNRGDGTFDHNYHWFDASGTCPGAPCDNHGHGTHTMGTMVGDGGEGNRIGVAPQVHWIATNGCCPTDEALITSGQWLLEPTNLAGEEPDASMRPNIINNSWGSELPSNDPFMEDITLAWEASGIFAVWSNGNSGPACQTSGSPGSLASNYSVGAYDSTGEIASFSSRGSGQDGAIKPDISAPGVDVRSTLPGDRYGPNQGTSMAAPHVAGAVALLWSAAPALVGDVATTRALLDGSAEDAEDLQCGGTAENNNVYGEGRLDALGLLDAAPVQGAGTLRLTVTDAGTGDPVPGAEVALAGPVDRERTTGTDGVLSVALPPGAYSYTLAAFGYPERSGEVTITTGEVASRDHALDALPTVRVRGRVTDGSGHRWPLYAALTVDGHPDGTVYTDPTDGRYELTVPARGTYRLTVESRYGGYGTHTEVLDVQHRPVLHNIEVPVDNVGCLDIGYRHAFDGLRETFDSDELPPGWTIVDHADTGHGWRFDDPRNRGNLTGGDGGFAVSHRESGVIGELDASLVTPVVDLTGHESPVLVFRQDYWRFQDVARIELSLDAGDTWQTLRQQSDHLRGPREELIPLPQAADQATVQVRFRLSNATLVTRHWQLDDVFVGTRTCEPVPGGLVVGHVRDANTGAPVNGAAVTRDDGRVQVESAATPDDPALDDGFYWAFSPFDRPHRFTATADHYSPDTQTRAVGNSTITAHEFRLPAGQLSVTDQVTVPVDDDGGPATAEVTVTNTGTAPADVELRERDSVYPIPRAGADAAVGSGDVVRVPGEFSPLADGAGAAGAPPAPESAASWVDLPPYPIRVADNAAAEHGGRIYSAGGMADGVQRADAYVFDPVQRSWEPIADLPAPVQAGAGAFIDGTFYVVGGWEPFTQGTRTVRKYDPQADSWSTGADAPFHFAAAGHAVLDGELYVVGGCTNSCNLSQVFRYDPVSDAWDTLARYPQGVSHVACGGIDGRLICAGGTRTTNVIFKETYAYDPETDSWNQLADLPIPLWGASYTVSSERLLVSGGVTGGAPGLGQPAEPTELTNQGFRYDPDHDRWTSLPASNQWTYRAGSTCGLTKVGGTMVVGFAAVNTAELLPTYGDCVPADVPWLSVSPASLVLDPGESVTVTVTVDGAGLPAGAHTAGFWIKHDTPYPVYPIDVIANVDASLEDFR